MMRIKKNTFTKIASYSIANYFYTAINAVSNIFVSNILGPVNNGVISYYSAINTNIDQVVYGTFRSSLERTIPQINSSVLRVEYAQQACTLNLYTTLVFSLLFVFIGLFASESLTQVSAFFMAVLNLTRSFADFYRIWIRAQNKISIVAIIMIITAVFIPFFAIIFSYQFGLQGFWVGRILIAVLSFGCLLYASRGFLKVVPIRYEFVKRIIISGGEIVIFSLCVSGIQTMDKYFVKAFLGIEQLGYYAIGSMVFTMLMLVPSSIIGAVYPKFVGMINHDLKDLVGRYSVVIEAFSLFVAVVAYILIPWLINRLMPKYVCSTSIIRILLIAFVAYASTQLRYIDIVRNKSMNILIKSSFVALAFSIVSFIIVSHISDDVNDFAWCTSFCFILLSVGVNYSWSKIYNFNLYKRLMLAASSILPSLLMLPMYSHLDSEMILILMSIFIPFIYFIRYKYIKL